MMVDRTNAGVFSCCAYGHDGYSLNLQMGKIRPSETKNITKRNKEGLFIEIFYGYDIETVLSGDVPYNSMWDKPFFLNN